jgi:hypothetical protein
MYNSFCSRSGTSSDTSGLFDDDKKDVCDGVGRDVRAKEMGEKAEATKLHWNSTTRDNCVPILTFIFVERLESQRSTSSNIELREH